MPSYKAPVADFEFLMFDVLEIEKHTDLNGYAELDRATVHDVLEGTPEDHILEVLRVRNQFHSPDSRRGSNRPTCRPAATLIVGGRRP